MKLRVSGKTVEIDFKNETVEVVDEKFSELTKKFVAYQRGEYKKDGEKNERTENNQ